MTIDQKNVYVDSEYVATWTAFMQYICNTISSTGQSIEITLGAF